MTAVVAILLLCAISIAGAAIMAGYALARERIKTDSDNERHAVDTQHAIARLAAESHAQMVEAQVKTQKQAAGDLFEAAKVVNQYGFRVMRDDEVPTNAAKMGFVVIGRQQWDELLHAIMSRTDVSGAGKKMLKQAGFLDPERPTWDDLHPKDD